jgi:hypothetical protein
VSTGGWIKSLIPRVVRLRLTNHSSFKIQNQSPVTSCWHTHAVRVPGTVHTKLALARRAFPYPLCAKRIFFDFSHSEICCYKCSGPPSPLAIRPELRLASHTSLHMRGVHSHGYLSKIWIGPALDWPGGPPSFSYGERSVLERSQVAAPAFLT